MRLVSAVLTLLLIVPNVAAYAEIILPSFVATILKEQFPEYKESENIEHGLRRYRVQLEYFREETLEGYNRAVLEYRQQLIDADGKLELDHKQGRVTSRVYTERHDHLRKELAKSQGTGEYMAAYYTYFKKYKAETKWVNAEVAVEERKRFKF